jgi:DNA-directed RNA polymerase specialized sigma24 family protein
MLRRDGHTRAQIAERLGMKLTAVHAAYRRAAAAGELPRERRHGSWEWAA